MGKEMGEVSNKMAGVAGIEPAITVLETVAIPFNYTPKKGLETSSNFIH